jgi:hypothetical protein
METGACRGGGNKSQMQLPDTRINFVPEDFFYNPLLRRRQLEVCQRCSNNGHQWCDFCLRTVPGGRSKREGRGSKLQSTFFRIPGQDTVGGSFHSWNADISHYTCGEPKTELGSTFGHGLSSHMEATGGSSPPQQAQGTAGKEARHRTKEHEFAEFAIGAQRNRLHA